MRDTGYHLLAAISIGIMVTGAALCIAKAFMN